MAKRRERKRKLNASFERFLRQKADWARVEMLKIHKLAPETRLASSLSPIEIFVVLYYGNILNYSPKNALWEQRDRFIVSKGHGAIALYPILADLGFYAKESLKNICKENSLFGSIPDCSIPGFEAINGSLGYGLGVACGIALALKKKRSKANVFVLTGDGELFEGANWEAIMFAAHHRLNNLTLIVDNNRKSMLGYCKDILDLCPLERKFKAFHWQTRVVDGHNIRRLYNNLLDLKKNLGEFPRALIANTKKGKGVRQLEDDPLCHTKVLKNKEIDLLIEKLEKK